MIGLTRRGLEAAGGILSPSKGVALIRTIIAVETRGSGFDREGRVIILYEPHVAWRNLPGPPSPRRGVPPPPSPERLKWQRLGLAYPDWGTRPYPRDSYPAFKAAFKVDPEVACRSCSWGMGQILGENHKAAGYSTAQDMAEAFAIGEGEQVAAMARFIRANPKMHAALVMDDWREFARRYNGPGYEKNAYHTKLAEAFARFKADPWRGFKDPDPMYKRPPAITIVDRNSGDKQAAAATVAAGSGTTAVAVTQKEVTFWPVVMGGGLFIGLVILAVFLLRRNTPIEREQAGG
jgi:hypothetical protein